MSKFYHITIETRDGEREYTSHTSLEASNIDEAEALAEDYAKDFYGDYTESDDSGHWHNGGETCTKVDSVQEITEAEFKVLRRFSL